MSSSITNKKTTSFDAKLSTTDGATSTLFTYPMAASMSGVFAALVVGKRTGGVSGSAGDSAAFLLHGGAKRIAAGSVTGIGSTALQTSYSTKDQGTWGATWNVSGNNIIIQVAGAANNNVSWHGRIDVSVI